MRQRFHWRTVLALLIPAALVGSLAVGLHASQVNSRAGVADRFVARGALEAGFIGTWVDELLAREHSVATKTLTGRDVLVRFDAAVGAFGFQSAVLVDDHGRALAVEPRDPAMIGTQVAAGSPYLGAALAGRSAVSSVVTTAARHLQLVHFAVPVDGPRGRLVFSGAYATKDTPLGAFLDSSLTISGAHLYLVDYNDDVIAANGGSAKGQSLDEQAPALVRAQKGGPHGYYDSTGGRYYFTRAQVPGSSWSLLMAAPTDRLFYAVDGASHWVPWVILAGLALIAAVAGLLTLRLADGRRRLADANATLGRIAQTDELTGLSNRRHMVETLAALMAMSRRHDVPLSVLMIDVDKFKQLNDTFGHTAGDEALRHVARTLRDGLRTEDALARWGGEEFFAVLPHSDKTGAAEVAERLRAAVAATPLPLGSGGDVVSCTISIGVAEYTGELPDVLTHRADLALYEAKRAGRNTFRVARTLVAAAIAGP